MDNDDRSTYKKRIERAIELLTMGTPEFAKKLKVVKTLEVYHECHEPNGWAAMSPLAFIMWNRSAKELNSRDRIRWMILDSCTIPEGYSFCYPRDYRKVMEYYGMTFEQAIDCKIEIPRQTTSIDGGLWLDRANYWDPIASPKRLTKRAFNAHYKDTEWDIDEVCEKLQALI